MCKQCANVKQNSRPVSALTNALQLWQFGNRIEATEYIQSLSSAELVQFVGFAVSGKFTDEARQIAAIVNA